MRAYKDFSENELCDLLKSGDYEAFSEIYERYSLQLLSHALRKCQDDDYAKDLLQEVFTMLWQNRETLDIRKSLSGYLATSIKYSFFKNLRHEEVKEKHSPSLAEFISSSSNNVTADHLIRRKQLEAIIENEVMALPPKMREIYEKYFVEGLSQKEIATELELSEKTVARQVYNIRERLRKKLPLIIYLFLIGMAE